MPLGLLLLTWFFLLLVHDDGWLPQTRLSLVNIRRGTRATLHLTRLLDFLPRNTRWFISLDANLFRLVPQHAVLDPAMSTWWVNLTKTRYDDYLNAGRVDYPERDNDGFVTPGTHSCFPSLLIINNGENAPC